MNDHNSEPRAIFLSPDGSLYPDTLICSGVIPPELGGKPCPFSQAGRMPDVAPLDLAATNYTVDKGQPGDLCQQTIPTSSGTSHRARSDYAAPEHESLAVPMSLPFEGSAIDLPSMQPQKRPVLV